MELEEHFGCPWYDLSNFSVVSIRKVYLTLIPVVFLLHLWLFWKNREERVK